MPPAYLRRFLSQRSLTSVSFFLPAIIVGGLLLPRLLLFVNLSTVLIVWPWQLDYDEGINLNATVQLAGGHNIYHHNGPEGFLSAPYPPLFYLVNAPVIWVAGPGFGVGRALSLISTVAIALLIAYIVWKITSVWPAGLLSGALWLCLSPVIVWSAFYKQDMPALALGLGGLAYALTYPEGRRVYFAALIFALAFYTKQSAISAATATSLWLIVRDLRIGLRFTLALLTLISLPFTVANIALHGGLWEHLVSYHTLPWSQRRFWWLSHRLWSEYWPLLAWGWLSLFGGGVHLVGLASGSASESARSKVARPPALVILYFIVGAVSTSAQLGYFGANFNHLLDALLPLCILVGLPVAWLWKQIGIKENFGKPGTARAVGGIALLGVLFVAQLFAFKDPSSWFYREWPNQKMAIQMRGLSSLVASTRGDIYSEDAYLILSNGRRIVYDDPSTFAVLAQLGRWDDSVVARAFRERRFALVLIWRGSEGSELWTKSELAAFRESYSLRFPDLMETYQPKVPIDASQDELECAMSERRNMVSLDEHKLGPGVAQTGAERTALPRFSNAC